MEVQKPRCRQCVYKNNSTSQEPCKNCSEIQMKQNGFDNCFLDASKDLMKEGK